MGMDIFKLLGLLNHITIQLVISIHLDDLSTLEYIRSVLKFGIIVINSDHKSANCRLIINRTDLQEVIFPLLLHHNIFFLTISRRNQFDLVMYILKEGIKTYDDIPTKEEIYRVFELPETPLGYVELPFF